MKKEYNSILKLLAVLIFAVMPIIFFGQETTEEDEQEPAQQEQVNKKASFSRYGYVGASIGGVAKSTRPNHDTWLQDDTIA